MAQTRILKPADNAYQYPLLIKRLLMSGPRYNPDQEIVYANRSKYTYKDLVDRIHRLANALTDAGVKPGDTVAVMDWDTPRYLECFFAIPMIGAILHTVNVRLSPEQIVYTMNHAEDDVVLVHDDFMPIIESVKDEIKTVKTWIQVTDEASAKATSIDTLGEYEGRLPVAERVGTVAAIVGHGQEYQAGGHQQNGGRQRQCAAQGNRGVAHKRL